MPGRRVIQVSPYLEMREMRFPIESRTVPAGDEKQSATAADELQSVMKGFSADILQHRIQRVH
jgi:hypothetical protein